jgi:hypothetical protein
MHMFLTRMPASSVSVLQTIPYLRLADLQVEHGGLQMKILIQVVEHQLGTIETVLGLPDEHRVFTRHDEPCLHNVPTICLDGRNVGTLLTDVMGNSVAASATRIVASLREEMAKVRHLL